MIRIAPVHERVDLVATAAFRIAVRPLVVTPATTPTASERAERQAAPRETPNPSAPFGTPMHAWFGDLLPRIVTDGTM